MQGRTVRICPRPALACAAWLIAATLALAPAAVAQPKARSQVTPDGAIQVVMGDRVTVRLPPDGRPELVSVDVAPSEFAAPPKPGAGRFDDTAPGTIVVTLQPFNGTDVMMKVQSGVSKTFDYRAVLIHEQVGGRIVGEPTSVCSVLPLLSGYEHWPNRPNTAGIVLRGFTFRDSNDVVCPDPATLPPIK